MIKFFSVMINISTIIAMIASAVFVVGILFKSKSISNVEVFNTCNNQIKVCRISSVIFAVLYWFTVSGLSTKECLEGYTNLSTTCSRLGCIWIAFAFLNVIVSVILGILKRGKEELEGMGKLRKSNFVMGAILLIIAFVLKVN